MLGESRADLSGDDAALPCPHTPLAFADKGKRQRCPVAEKHSSYTTTWGTTAQRHARGGPQGFETKCPTTGGRRTSRCNPRLRNQLSAAPIAIGSLLPHNGLLMVSAKAPNMTLKLMLILCLSLRLASTECGSQAGKSSSVPFWTFTTT